jgi:hypothetical protein
MPFRQHVHLSFTNHGDRPTLLFFQIDYTLQTVADDAGFLHVAFRRENPTELGRDFVIADGLRGPGRFLGCAVGVRVIDAGNWYGEGEVKIFRDGDEALPTICGTGLEDYVGSAWGLGVHHAPYAGAPLDEKVDDRSTFVGFYRWHVPDPVMFEHELRVTIQQIGSDVLLDGDDAGFERIVAERRLTPTGLIERPAPGIRAVALHERQDDYSAAAFVYCTEPQPVPAVDVAAAVADLGGAAPAGGAPPSP